MTIEIRELTGWSFSSKNAHFFLRHSCEFFYQRQTGTPLQFPPSILKDFFPLDIRDILTNLFFHSKYDMKKLLERSSSTISLVQGERTGCSSHLTPSLLHIVSFLLLTICQVFTEFPIFLEN